MRAETCEELQKIVGEDLLQSPQLRFPSSAKEQTGFKQLLIHELADLKLEDTSEQLEAPDSIHS
ncbi:hypothetical protein DY000_02028060, partial [Brassica cretica]